MTEAGTLRWGEPFAIPGVEIDASLLQQLDEQPGCGTDFSTHLVAGDAGLYADDVSGPLHVADASPWRTGLPALSKPISPHRSHFFNLDGMSCLTMAL